MTILHRALRPNNPALLARHDSQIHQLDPLPVRWVMRRFPSMSPATARLVAEMFFGFNGGAR